MNTTTEKRTADNIRIAIAHPEQARAAILAALSAWVNQRPGLEYGNYGDAASYRHEMRRITNQRADAFELLAAIGWRESIDARQLLQAFRAFSGRLSVTLAHDAPGTVTASLDYCTGQYWPTEYRAAACAVLASALWDYYRTDCPPDDMLASAGLSAGSWIRCTIAREFGTPLARRWFDYDHRAAADMRRFRARQAKVAA
jgi:hypothetical protein